MFDVFAAQSLSRTEILTRLGRGSAEGITVVTPNRRLALSLIREFNKAQASKGAGGWETADVLPLSAFVERAHADLRYSDPPCHPPMLMRNSQVLATWERVVRDGRHGEIPVAVPEAARLAREAWQILHRFQLLPKLEEHARSDDNKAFLAWSKLYTDETRLKGWIDQARLPSYVAERSSLPFVRKPRLLICYGFDEFPPQDRKLLTALREAGSEIVLGMPEPRRGSVIRLALRRDIDEIEHAARWARERLEENPDARIGIVVPDLGNLRSTVQRVLGSITMPSGTLPGASSKPLPYDISLGTALIRHPLVDSAFLALELAERELDFERVSMLLRSPFIAGAIVEADERARLDALLRRRAEPRMTLPRLLKLCAQDNGQCAQWRAMLATLLDFSRERLRDAQLPSALAQAILEVLKLAGFPGTRALDSSEHQTLEKWHEALAEFGALDRVAGRMRYADAVVLLRRIASELLFQPESPESPIEVLGVIEAQALRFDHLWVMGLSSDAWPPGARPNPLIPLELQRSNEHPRACAENMLRWAQRTTNDWLVAADEVILSYPMTEADRTLKPSPLIAGIVEDTTATISVPSYHSAIHHSARMESLDDQHAPPLAAGTRLAAGTAIIKDQAACPFRAFGAHRLGARGLELPHHGLDAAERGELVHHVLASVWKAIGDSASLAAMAPDALGTLLCRAATSAISRLQQERPDTLRGRFLDIERRRLVRLANDWLAIERTRPDFSVVAIEDKRELHIGALAFNARLDRVDQLPDGRRIIIDYKTGQAGHAAWLGARPDEPQLPVYLTGLEPAAAAIAFAKVAAGEMKWVALARDADVLPDALQLPYSRLKSAGRDWQAQTDAWRRDLGNLADEFVAGVATVDPRQGPQTCRYCELQPLCRIHHRRSTTPAGDEPPQMNQGHDDDC